MINEIRDLPSRAQSYSNPQIWRPVAELLYRGFTDNFATASTAGGVPWPPRKSKRAGNPLLILTSLLIRSVGGQAASIFAADAFSLTLGVIGRQVPYAAIHNEGTATMPQREFLDVDADTRDEAAAVFLDDFTQHLFPAVT